MKKILLIFFFSISFLSAEINEYVSDVYFANGIDTSYSQAKKSRDDLNISTMIKYPKAYKSVKNWQISYNHPRSHVIRGNAYCNRKTNDNMAYFYTSTLYLTIIQKKR